MLTSIKERATGWIAWAIVILITIPFALWGVNSYFSGVTETVVAEVNGDEIDYRHYQQVLYEERDRLRNEVGGTLDPAFLSGSVLGRRVVTRMISDRLLSEAASDIGYSVSDEQLAEFIRSESSFHTDGEFDMARYERLLFGAGMSPSEFEEIQRTSAAIHQMRTGFALSAMTLSDPVDDGLALLLHDRLGDYAIVRPEMFVSEVKVSDAEIEAEYESDPQPYREPARMKIEYVELTASDYAQDYEPAEDELRQIYETRNEEFLSEEQRSVSHILIELEGDGASRAESLARDVAERARSGEDFASLASEYSADAGSAGLGGSIGLINRGVTAPEFEAAAFSMERGAISDPVRTEFGYHVIRVDEIIASEIEPYDEVRGTLVELASAQHAERELFDVAEEVKNLAYEQPDSLRPLTEALGLEVKASEWFSEADGAGIAGNPAVKAAAFSDLVLNDEFNSDLVEISAGHFVVLRKLDYRASEILPLETVRGEIRERLLARKSGERAQEFAQSVAGELGSGDDVEWSGLLAERGLESSPLPRNVGSEPPDEVEVALLDAVYSGARPAPGAVIYATAPLRGGSSYAVYRITDVTYGVATEADARVRDQVSILLEQRFGAELFSGFAANLFDTADITINDDAL